MSSVKNLPPCIYDSENYRDVAYNTEHKRKLEYRLWISYENDKWEVAYWRMFGGDLYSKKIHTVDMDLEMAAEGMLGLLAEKGYEKIKGFEKV